jgi:single-stranded-DNA-specific exonuclease
VDRRGAGVAGTLADLVASGEPVLVACAAVHRRLDGLRARLGGFALCAWSGLERDPALADPYVHVVALDPPAHPHQLALVQGRIQDGWTHLAWGRAELRFAQQIHEQEFALRAPLAALYRALRARDGAGGEELEAVLRGDGPHPRSPALAGRLVRVLAELGLVSLDRDRRALRVPPAQRTALERSAAFRAYARRHEDGLRYLTDTTAQAA